MKKVLLVFFVAIGIFTGCDKKQTDVSELSAEVKGKISSNHFEKNFLNPEKNELADVDGVENEISEDVQTWVYSFPEELMQKSTTEKYFTRKDWYTNINDNTDLNYDSITNCNDLDRILCLTVYKKRKDDSFVFCKKNEFENGMLIHSRNEDGDAFSDEYREYDELGRLQKLYYVFDGNPRYVPDEMNFYFSYSFDEKNSKLICRRISADGQIRLYEELQEKNEPNTFIVNVKIDEWEGYNERRYADSQLMYFKQEGSKQNPKEYFFKYENDNKICEVYLNGDLLNVLEMIKENKNGVINSWNVKGGEKNMQWQNELLGFDEHGNWIQQIKGEETYKREIVYK